MRLFISIFGAALGSLLGGAARAGTDIADNALRGGDEIGTVNISGSITAAVVGGVVGNILGGPRRAFWLGAVLGAAGASRFDAMILRRFGVDPEALVARAGEAAERVRAARQGGHEESAEA